MAAGLYATGPIDPGGCRLQRLTQQMIMARCRTRFRGRRDCALGASDAVLLVCSHFGQVLPGRDDLDPLKAPQPSEVSIARNDIVRMCLDCTLEELIIAGIVADNLNASRRDNKEDMIGVMEQREQGSEEMLRNACPLQNDKVFFENRRGEAEQIEAIANSVNNYPWGPALMKLERRTLVSTTNLLTALWPSYSFLSSSRGLPLPGGPHPLLSALQPGGGSVQHLPKPGQSLPRNSVRPRVWP